MNTTMYITKSELQRLIEETPRTALMSITFIKVDGSVRKLLGNRGVKKHLAGGKTTVDISKYWIFYDFKAKGYRAVNKSTIIAARINKVNYEVINGL